MNKLELKPTTPISPDGLDTTTSYIADCLGKILLKDTTDDPFDNILPQIDAFAKILCGSCATQQSAIHDAILSKTRKVYTKLYSARHNVDG